MKILQGYILSVAMGAVALSPAFGKEDAGASPKGSDVIATVNGATITRADINLYLRHKRAENPSDPVNPNTLLNEMINRELLREAALKQGIDKRAGFTETLELQRTNLLVNTLVSEKVTAVDFSEDVLKAEYDRQIAEASGQEYKARHILLETGDEAKAVIKELKDGADFIQLAKDKSTGPSGPNGGDLGWFQLDAMVPEFGDALKDMKKGKSSKTPVQTQFGWHVILLEDTRKLEAPGYEKSKERLKAIVANKALQGYLNGLRKDARVEIKQPKASRQAQKDNGK